MITPRVRRQFRVAFGAWTLVALLSYLRYPLESLAKGRITPSFGIAVHSLVSCWVWALFTPLILALSEKFPLEKGRRARNAAVHAGAAVASVIVSAPLTVLLLRLLRVSAGPQSIGTALLAESFIDVFSYAAVVAVGHALIYQRIFTEERLRRSELEASLLTARMEALEARLHPHFLFNALNTVSSLIRTGDARAAIRAVARLGDLMRTLLLEDGQEVPLSQELEFVGRYLELEQARFGERLVSRIEVDPLLMDALVPRLVLQPLVENALRHGIEPSTERGTVEVHAARTGDMLELEVRDSGGGQGNSTPSTRIGLANTRARLAQLYGERQQLALQTSASGTVARVVIPFRPQARQ